MLAGAPAVPGQKGDRFMRAGRAVGVGGSTLRRYNTVIERANDATRQAMLEGKISIKSAWKSVMIAGEDGDPDTWLTPPEILDAARAETSNNVFDLDPATTIANPTKAERFLTKEINGLESSWADAENIWINPPYTAILPWIEKSIATVLANPDTRIWMLIPASTGTRHGQAALRAANAICFLKGRVRHLRIDGTPKGSPKFDSMVVGFGSATLAEFEDLGVVFPISGAIPMRHTAEQSDESWYAALAIRQMQIDVERDRFEQDYLVWLRCSVAA